MENIRGKRQPLLFVATAVAFSLVIFSSGFSSKVLADTPKAKYQVGNAWKETNGYSLVSHRNWYGTVVSVQPGNTILDTRMAIIMTMLQSKMLVIYQALDTR